MTRVKTCYCCGRRIEWLSVALEGEFAHYLCATEHEAVDADPWTKHDCIGGAANARTQLRKRLAEHECRGLRRCLRHPVPHIWRMAGSSRPWIVSSAGRCAEDGTLEDASIPMASFRTFSAAVEYVSMMG